jgi:hypothetical protein
VNIYKSFISFIAPSVGEGTVHSSRLFLPSFLYLSLIIQKKEKTRRYQPRVQNKQTRVNIREGKEREKNIKKQKQKRVQIFDQKNQKTKFASKKI